MIIYFLTGISNLPVMHIGLKWSFKLNLHPHLFTGEKTTKFFFKVNESKKHTDKTTVFKNSFQFSRYKKID